MTKGTSLISEARLTGQDSYRSLNAIFRFFSKLLPGVFRNYPLSKLDFKSLLFKNNNIKTKYVYYKYL